MRLSAFRIQNYKTISDTGRVEVRPNVTCLLGKNESGKSSVMQAIWKASNVAGGKYDTLYDYPSNVEFLKAVYVMNGWGELSHAEKARIVLALVDSWRSGSAAPGAKTLANTDKLIDGLVARFGS